MVLLTPTQPSINAGAAICHCRLEPLTWLKTVAGWPAMIVLRQKHEREHQTRQRMRLAHFFPSRVILASLTPNGFLPLIVEQRLQIGTITPA